MSPHHRRFSTLGAAVVLACAVSTSAFGSVADLRTPDTVTPVVSAQPATPAVDLRSPDAVTPVTATPVVVDLRSPDAVDLASGSRIATREPVVSISSPKSGGFDWGDAGIGAGGALAIVLLGFGAAMMATHRRQGIKAPRTLAH